MPQFLPDGRIGFLTKSGKNEGIGYTSGSGTFPGSLRSPAWSPDGKRVIYEKVDYTPRPQNQLLYSWDPRYEYRYTDVFPSFSKNGLLLVTSKDVDSSVVTMNADGSNRKVVFQAVQGAAFAPSWSPDGERIAFGYGGFLQGGVRAEQRLSSYTGTALESKSSPPICRMLVSQVGLRMAKKLSIVPSGQRTWDFGSSISITTPPVH